MSLFDSIISGADEKFGLGNKAGTLVSALLSLMTNQNRGGFAGFLDKTPAPALASYLGPFGPSIAKPAGKPSFISLIISTSDFTPPRVDEPREAP